MNPKLIEQYRRIRAQWPYSYSAKQAIDYARQAMAAPVVEWPFHGAWDGARDTFDIPGRPDLIGTIEIERDDDSGRPWKEAEGWAEPEDRRRAYAGEDWPGSGYVRLHDNWIYPMHEALAKARKEYAQYMPKVGKAERDRRALQSVQAEREFYGEWLNDEWQWIGVIVKVHRLDDNDDPGELLAEHSLWSVESRGDYWQDVAGELLAQCMADIAQAERLERIENRFRDAMDNAL